MVDRNGRVIDYLRVSLTDRCNLRCIYCMPESGICKKTHDEIMRFEDVEKIIEICSELGVKKVRFTGGEPLILPNIENLINTVSKINNINDISITTNGILLFERANELKKAGLRRVNISLDTLDFEKFKYITRGGNLNNVLDAINLCIKLKLTPVKINVVLLKGINDNEILEFIELSKRLPVQVRFIELMPLGEGAKYFEKHYMKTEEVIERVPDLVEFKDKSKVASVYKIPGSMGSVGLINPVSCKFCNNCDRIRITSTGFLKPCLHSYDEIDLKKYINNLEKLKYIIKNAIYEKPKEHYLDKDKKSNTDKLMNQIGG